MRRFLERSLRRLGYTVLKMANYERLIEKIRIAEESRVAFAQSLAKVEHLEAELAALKAQAPDYQVLMAHQNALAALRDLDPDFGPVMDFVKPFTMTSVERLYTLFKAVEYLSKAKIPGDLLECGVWRGGSMMLVARTLLAMGDTSRNLYLFDTYEGHPKPDSEHDVDLWGNVAVREWEKHRKTDETSDWGYVSIEEVRANLETTGYPMDKVVLVKGMVEKTLSARVPLSLSLARLDTDWYASARVGLEACWPRLQRGGILIVDDYGHYRGQRKAVDEYFAASPVMLHRVDYSCRTIVKTN